MVVVGSPSSLNGDKAASSANSSMPSGGPPVLDREETARQANVQSPARIRIIVSQPEPIFRDSLCTLLQGAGFDVIGRCSDEKETVEMTRGSRPEMLLLGATALADSSGFIQMIRECVKQCRVVLLSRDLSQNQMVQYLQTGVHGILTRTDETHSLFECLSKVAQGGYWLSSEGITTLVQSVVALGNGQHKVSNQYGLTRRESEIILEVLEGYSNPEIAAHFSLSEQTVKHHVSHIFDKLGVYSRVELALFAVNHGIVAE